MPIVLEVRTQTQKGCCKFKVCLVYIASSRLCSVQQKEGMGY